jgi:hypothetical protein
MASRVTDIPHKPTRRDLLKTTATVAVTSALALNRGAVGWAKEPADATAGMLPQVDAPDGSLKAEAMGHFLSGHQADMGLWPHDHHRAGG